MVKETYNYNQFKFSPWNRDIKEKTLAKIDRDVKKNGWKKHPILVNKNWEVIDGQHRLTYAKEHHLPISYVIVEDLDVTDCVTMNNTRSTWELGDYIKLYAQEGNINYIRLRNLIQEFSFTGVTTLTSMIFGTASNGNISPVIKSGKFEITEDEYLAARTKLRFIQNLSPYVIGAKGRGCAIYQALSFCYDYDKVDNERLEKKFKERVGAMTPPANIDMAFKEMEIIYNHKIPQAKYVPIFADYQQYRREKILHGEEGGRKWKKNNAK